MIQILLGIAAGLMIGLPQGLSDMARLGGNGLPKDTIVIVGLFGTFGGAIFAFQFLARRYGKQYSVPGYFFFLTGTLSIGLPQAVKHYNGDIIQDITIPALFFSSAGVAMGLVGLAIYVYKAIT